MTDPNSTPSLDNWERIHKYQHAHQDKLSAFRAKMLLAEREHNGAEAAGAVAVWCGKGYVNKKVFPAWWENYIRKGTAR